MNTNQNIENLITNSSNFSAFNESFTTTSGEAFGGSSGTANYYYYPAWSGWGWYSSPPSKTEQAYGIIRALMKTKLIKITTLNKFFEVMDEIVKII